MEHKTAARPYTEDQLRLDVQPTAYKRTAWESGLSSVALRFQVLTKTKVPVVRVADGGRAGRSFSLACR